MRDHNPLISRQTQILYHSATKALQFIWHKNQINYAHLKHLKVWYTQPRTHDLSLGKTLAAAGHVTHQKFGARGGVGKVLNYIYMLPGGYSLKT
jgi:hypothetical protein